MKGKARGHQAKDRRRGRRVTRSSYGRTIRRYFAASRSAQRAAGRALRSPASHAVRGERAQNDVQWSYAKPKVDALEHLGAFASSRSGSAILRTVAIGAVFAIAFAHTALPAHAGFLDGMQDSVKNAAVGWMDNSLQLATALFSIMMTVTLVTAIARYASLNHTIEGFGHVFMDLFIKIIPLYVLMASATTLLPNVVNVANALAGQITGAPVNGPSEIFGLGVKISVDIMKAAMMPLAFAGLPGVGEGAVMLGTLSTVVGMVMALLIMTVFTLIAFEYFFAFAQAYITLSVGAISLGWLASGGTKQMGEAYLAGAWMSMMRLIMTIAVVALIVAMVPHMMEIAATSDIKAMFMSWLSLGGSAIFAALIATKIPAFATHVFSGQPAVSAPAVANAALRSGARVARAAVGAVG